MKKKVIEEVLNKIIDIDEKTLMYNAETDGRIKKERDILEWKIKEKEKKVTEVMNGEGKTAYEKMIKDAENKAEDIIKTYESRISNMEKNINEKKEEVKEKIIREIFGNDGENNV